MEQLLLITLIVITCGSCMTLCIIIIKLGYNLVVNGFDKAFQSNDVKETSKQSVLKDSILLNQESQVVPEIDFKNRYAATKFFNNVRASDKNWQDNFGKARYHIVDQLQESP